MVVPGTGGTIDIPDYGITLTGGSGTVAFVDGDTAYFDARPANTKTTEIVMGDKSDLKNLGLVLVYPRNSNGQHRIVDFPKVAVGGTSFAGNTREYAEFEFTGMPLLEENDELYTKTEILVDC